MPEAQLKAAWAGQTGQDWTGPGPAVGPDGFEDACLELAGLSTRLEVEAIVVEHAGGATWEYGLNAHRFRNAELIRHKPDPSRGSLFFSPDRDMSGAELHVRILYRIERTCSTTVLAGTTDPKRPMPKPPEFGVAMMPLNMEWLGQDGKDPTGPGDVHITVAGLPGGCEVVAAALTDKVGGCWVYRRDDQVAFFPLPGNWELTQSLHFQRSEKNTRAELFLQPYRDETATPMLLRLLLDDGATVFSEILNRRASCRRPIQPNRWKPLT